MTGRVPNRLLLPALPPVPQIINRIPRPYPQPQEQELGKLIWGELFKIWVSLLTEAERSDCEQGKPSTGFAKLDALIIRQAETFGWRLVCSEMVLRRFERWDFLPHGPELFDRFGKAVARSARRFQERELPPIDDPDLPAVRSETIEELRPLLKTLRGSFSAKRTKPTAQEIAEQFCDIVMNEPETFPHLRANLASWLAFLLGEPESTTFRALALGARTSPASVFDSWLSWSKGQDVDTIRQAISRMPKG